MLCTRSQTFALKHVQTTNAVLLIPPTLVTAVVSPSLLATEAASVLSLLATTQVRRWLLACCGRFEFECGQLSVVSIRGCGLGTTPQFSYGAHPAHTNQTSVLCRAARARWRQWQQWRRGRTTIWRRC